MSKIKSAISFYEKITKTIKFVTLFERLYYFYFISLKNNGTKIIYVNCVYTIVSYIAFLKVTYSSHY